MEPLSLAIGAIGLGLQIFGGSKQVDNSRAQAAVSRDEATQEQGINDQKQQAMELDARRKQTEIIRTNQQAQALAVNRATNQGAQFGSGLQGGLAEVQDQSLFNLAGINSSLSIGRNINQFNQNITQDKYKMADLGGDAASNQALTSLGGTLLKVGPTIGAMSKGLFSGNSNPYDSMPKAGVDF